ncbi:MAG: hypothetical protein ACKO37_01335, partial [Vampirovibrionales bacterium]
MTTPSFPYQGILIRDLLDDTGQAATTGVPCVSPDIIPYGNDILSPAVASSTYNSDIGKPLSVGTGSTNNIFVRAKNLNPQVQTGNVNLYYATASLLNAPSIGGSWNPLVSASGLSAVPLCDTQNPSSLNIASQDVALSQTAFSFNNVVPPGVNDHYCLLAVVNDPQYPVDIPSSWATNSAFASWVQGNPAVAWRNLCHTATQSTFSATYMFGNLNASAESVEFHITT